MAALTAHGPTANPTKSGKIKPNQSSLFMSLPHPQSCRRVGLLVIWGVGVEKVRATECLFSCGYALPSFVLSVELSGGGQHGYWWLAEEAYEPFDVLGHRSQEELLAHELQRRRRKRRSPI